MSGRISPADFDWVHKTSAVGHLRLACTYGGELHTFYWGQGTSPVDCVQISRVDSQHYSVSADASCVAEDRVVTKSGVTVRSGPVTMPFTATITTATAVV